MLHDFRFAFRQLLKARGFTATAVIVLAFGIGANTAIFALMNTLLFQPPRYSKPDEVVQIFSQDKRDPKTFRGFSYPTYVDIRDSNTVFSGVMAHNLAMVGVGDTLSTRRVFTDVVSSNYFSVMGVAPIQGRAFRTEEETPGRNAAVAIVSYNYWKKEGLDPAMLGSTITIDSRPFSVIGILPEGFTGTTQVFSPEIFLPLGVYDQVANDFETGNKDKLENRAGRQFILVGRLKPGTTMATANAALKTMAANFEQTYPIEQKDQTFMVERLSRFSLSTSPGSGNKIKRLAPLLFGMSAMVLTVACLNLANMLLARGAARRREIAIRLALGGSRWRIVRQLLCEGFVLALVGGGAGLALGLWSSDLLVISLGRSLPIDIVWQGGLNGPVLVATFAFCLLATLAFALGPALTLSKGAVIEDLKKQVSDIALVRRRWKFLPRNPLVVVQIAFSLALLTAAALFIRGAGKAADVDTGLQVDSNYLLEVDASLATYDKVQSQAIYRTLEERLAALPGVQSASISSSVPFGMISLDKSVQRGGVNPAPDAKPATAADGLAFEAKLNSVGADYFKTVGLPLLRGRAFNVTEAMHQNSPQVAIIDDVLAKKLWPDDDALGQRIQFPESDSANASNGSDTKRQVEVVGIVPYTRSELFGNEQNGTLYLPFAGGFQSNVFFHVKFASNAGHDSNATTDLIRRTIREVDSSVPILSLKTFAQHLESNFELWIVRAGAGLFSVFGAVALLLATVGLYGVKAYSVARRTREIGIRMALGARGETVQWMFVREGAVMIGGGIAIGLLLAIATGKLVSGLLYGVGALDPVAFTVAPIVLSAAALLATWLPARRATRISPMSALRTE